MYVTAKIVGQEKFKLFLSYYYSLNLIIMESHYNQSYNGLSLLSWNVNKYGNEAHKWLKKYVKNKENTNDCFDIIFLSETKETETILKKYFDEFVDYNYIINVHNPAKYHGVAMLIHKKYNYDIIPINLNIECRKDSIGNNPSK